MPAFTQNQYGANFGGPVVIPHLYNGRRKTFFFVNWEGFGLRQGATYTTTVPDVAAFTNLDLSEWGQKIYDPTTTCATVGGCPAGSPSPARPGQRTPDIEIRVIACLWVGIRRADHAVPDDNPGSVDLCQPHVRWRT